MLQFKCFDSLGSVHLNYKKTLSHFSLTRKVSFHRDTFLALDKVTLSAPSQSHKIMFLMSKVVTIHLGWGAK